MVISVSGSVRHMRPLPSDSTTQTPPVSAMRKLAPETPVLTRRNFSRRKVRAASARSAGSVAEVREVHLAHEDLADLLAILMQRGNDDVRGQVVAKLDDELGEVGLVGVDAGGFERVVEADLLGGHRLDLDDFLAAGSA